MGGRSPVYGFSLVPRAFPQVMWRRRPRLRVGWPLDAKAPQRHRDGALTRSRDGLRYVNNGNALAPEYGPPWSQGGAVRIQQGSGLGDRLVVSTHVSQQLSSGKGHKQRRGNKRSRYADPPLRFPETKVRALAMPQIKPERTSHEAETHEQPAW